MHYLSVLALTVSPESTHACMHAPINKIVCRCMSVFGFVCAHVCVNVLRCVNVYVYLCICMSAWVCVCMHVCVVCVSVCPCSCVRKYVCVTPFVCVRVHTCVHVCMCIGVRVYVCYSGLWLQWTCWDLVKLIHTSDVPYIYGYIKQGRTERGFHSCSF